MWVSDVRRFNSSGLSRVSQMAWQLGLSSRACRDPLLLRVESSLGGVFGTAKDQIWRGRTSPRGCGGFTCNGCRRPYHREPAVVASLTRSAPDPNSLSTSQWSAVVVLLSSHALHPFPIWLTDPFLCQVGSPSHGKNRLM